MSQKLLENVEENLVRAEEGRVFTTTLIVAETFEKNHKNVLRAVENLECSEEFHERNFAPMVYEAEIGSGAKREFPAFELTRDGFVFLVMGFTGKKAAAWKEKFLEAFNAMEAALLGTATSPKLRRRIDTININCTKQRSEEARAVRALVPFWSRMEGESEQYLEQKLCTMYDLSSLDQMADWDLELVEWSILLNLFRATQHETEEEATPEQLHVLENLLVYCAGWRKLSREYLEKSICKICYVKDLKHLDAVGIQKAELAVWTFMNRYSSTSDFIGYPKDRQKNAA